MQEECTTLMKTVCPKKEHEKKEPEVKEEPEIEEKILESKWKRSAAVAGF